MKIAVIGAGPSGLTTIKQLRDEGHDVVCFDKGGDVGGIWHRHENDDAEMKVYDEMKLTISMKLMCFSDHMVEDRVFATRQEYLDYLHSYADRYELRQHIKFGTEVTSVTRTDDGWLVSSVADGQQNEEFFGAVALCSGPFHKPNMRVTGLDKFTGEVAHSSRYRNNRRYRGKRVLVIGLAESGADIVRQISDVATSCTLSIRTRLFLLPRLFKGKYSTDSYTIRAHHYEMWLRATDFPFPLKAFFEDETMARSDFLSAMHDEAILSGVTKLADQISLDSLAGHLRELGPVGATAAALAEAVSAGDDGIGVHTDGEPLNCLGQRLYPAQLDLFAEATPEAIDYINQWNIRSHNGTGCYAPSRVLCKNVTFVPNILNGKIQVNDSGIADIDGNTVYFKDYTAAEYDTIVLCTGFEQDFSLLKDIELPGNNVRNLYKHSIHPQFDGTLAFIGFARPYSGGIPICAEMQARYFALICSGARKLPSDIDEQIKVEKAWEERFTRLSPQHSQTIPSQIFFLDSIAREIGCLPTCKEMLDDPELLVKMWFHTFNQACYRLCGPHSMREEAIASIKSEELPGRSIASMFAFIASSLLPPHVHPRDQLMIQSPGGGVAPF